MNTQLKVGDLVVVKPEYAKAAHAGVVYRITKFMQVNLEAESVANGRKIRGNPEVFELTSETADHVIGIPYQAPLVPGEVVRVAGPGWRQPADVYYVVIHEGNNRKVKVARLGGDSGRYWPSIPRSMITVVDPSRIKVVD